MERTAKGKFVSTKIRKIKRKKESKSEKSGTAKCLKGKPRNSKGKFIPTNNKKRPTPELVDDGNLVELILDTYEEVVGLCVDIVDTNDTMTHSLKLRNTQKRRVICHFSKFDSILYQNNWMK